MCHTAFSVIFHRNFYSNHGIHECLSDGGMDPSDISNVMPAFKAKAGNPPQDSSRKINTHQRYVFARAN